MGRKGVNMELIRCENGHFYDLSKYDSCPYCRKKSQETSLLQQKIQVVPEFWVQNNNINEAVTVAMPVKENQEIILGGMKNGVSAGVSADDDQMTMAFYAGTGGIACVTGWIVCIEGPERGRDYRICHGMNWIGRDVDMDIYIPKDKMISGKKHCAIVYDEKSNSFFIVDGGVGLTYLNGHLVKQDEILKLGDVITIGKSKFEFVPFCREGHQWK